VNTEDELFLKEKIRREGGMKKQKKKPWRPLKEKQRERR
jgi:hypothetical protein